MAVSKEATAYILHQCQEHGRDANFCSVAWSSSYPDDSFTVAEADAVLSEAGVKVAKKAAKKTKKAKK